MPEGHTIHRLARDLNRNLAGATVIASSPQGRFDDGAQRIDGQGCLEFDAWGKHLFGHFDSGDVLHVHLGLIGKFRRRKGEPVGAVRLRLGHDEWESHWDLRGPMVCTLVSPDEQSHVTAKLGPDPLRASAGDRAACSDFAGRLARRRIGIGAALLDQSVIAGIGNVYRAELLFLAGIDPRRPARDLDADEVELLWREACRLLAIGVRLNRIVTVDPAAVDAKNHRAVPRGQRLYAYKRAGDPCRVCDDRIAMIEVGGRKLWWCPTCQLPS